MQQNIVVVSICDAWCQTCWGICPYNIAKLLFLSSNVIFGPRTNPFVCWWCGLTRASLIHSLILRWRFYRLGYRDNLRIMWTNKWARSKRLTKILHQTASSTICKLIFRPTARIKLAPFPRFHLMPIPSVTFTCTYVQTTAIELSHGLVSRPSLPPVWHTFSSNFFSSSSHMGWVQNYNICTSCHFWRPFQFDSALNCVWPCIWPHGRRKKSHFFLPYGLGIIYKAFPFWYCLKCV